MSKYYTAKQREKLRVALAISVAAMEVAQTYRKRRIKPQDTAIMYLNAAIAELKYGEKQTWAL